MATLRKVGFAGFTVEDQRDGRLEMADDVRRKLLGVELAVGLGKLDLSKGKRLARRAVELIEDGSVGVEFHRVGLLFLSLHSHPMGKAG